MISKRVKRSPRPQENLRQFSLNTSKGIDETRPITDSDTVSEMKNLTVNPDGSLSLRKRMLATYSVPSNPDSKLHLMFTGEHVLRCDSEVGIAIYNRFTGDQCTLSYEGADYYNYTKIALNVAAPKDWFSTKNATFVNTSDTTVIGNSYVSAAKLSDSSNYTGALGDAVVLDSSLYDDVTKLKVLRYIQISKDSETTFKARIINPELNTITTSEDGFNLNPNMTLDNPFAIRDSYNSSVTQVSGIVAYYKQSPTAFYTKSDASLKTAVFENKLDDSYTNIDSMTINSPEYCLMGSVNSVLLGIKFYSYENNLKFSIERVDDKSSDTLASTHGENFYVVIRASLYRKKGSLGEAPEPAELNWQWGPEDVEGVRKYTSATNTSTWVDSTVSAKNPAGGVVAYASHRSYYYSDALEKYTPDNYAKSKTMTVGAELDPSDYNMSQSEFPNFDNLVIQNITATFHYATYTFEIDTSSDISVRAISEYAGKSSEFKGISELSPTSWDHLLLKAFTSGIPGPFVYCAWDYSLDGAVWDPYGPIPKYNVVPGVKLLEEYNEPNGLVIRSLYAYPFYSYSPKQDVLRRPDVLPLEILQDCFGDIFEDTLTLTFRFRIFTIQTDSLGSRPHQILGEKSFNFITGPETVFMTSDMPNAVLGEKLYYKKAIYSYGTRDYGTFAYSTEPDSFITPMYSVLDLDVNSEDTVCQIVPWRDYLATFTEKSVYLSTKSEDGFYTKTVSTSVGVPFIDRYCVKAALNGILFKAGSKVYFAYPNLYSGDDSTLTLTDISKSISQVLDTIPVEAVGFADVIDDKYVLMLPLSEDTVCLCYDLSTKTWEVYKYPVVFKKFFKDPVRGVSAVASNGKEYLIFDDDYSRVDSKFNSIIPEEYVDVLDRSNQGTFSPISYSLDTGQKTDSIVNTKQFVETKLMFATLSERDAFPFTLYVAIDGDPHVTKMDVSTDAPFWKLSDNSSRGALGTNFTFGEVSPAAGMFNTLRQMVIRYSGKGKSIRHVIEGESLHNFKLYETYVRYKNISGK